MSGFQITHPTSLHCRFSAQDAMEELSLSVSKEEFNTPSTLLRTSVSQPNWQMSVRIMLLSLYCRRAEGKRRR
jgi:hypothetical protein